MMVAVTSVALVSCEYDDSGLWDKVDELEKQVQANSEDIATLSALVDALNQGKVITATEQTEEGVLSVHADRKTHLVKLSNIIYLESAGEYVRLHLADGTKLVTLFRLKNMETELQSSQFMRVHRSYIVNLNYVKGYARGRVYLSNDEYVPLSANYRDQFREFLDSKGI